MYQLLSQMTLITFVNQNVRFCVGSPWFSKRLTDMTDDFKRTDIWVLILAHIGISLLLPCWKHPVYSPATVSWTLDIGYQVGCIDRWNFKIASSLELITSSNNAVHWEISQYPDTIHYTSDNME